MKKIIFLMIFLLLVGCEKPKEELENKEEKLEIEEKKEESEEVYVDDNPIKIALYRGNNGEYKRTDTFKSKLKEITDVGVFSIILSNDEEIHDGVSIKNLYKTISSSIDNFNHYKTGFNIKFTLKDGTIINENIFKPLLYANYTFSPYLYVWIYDDVNTTGWHSHIEEEDFNENTIMSSIKLMWANEASQIDSNIELTVFTYDDDDFDEAGNYRGISKFTTIIEKE